MFTVVAKLQLLRTMTSMARAQLKALSSSMSVAFIPQPLMHTPTAEHWKLMRASIWVYR